MRVLSKVMVLGVSIILTACSNNMMHGKMTAEEQTPNNKPTEQVIGANTKPGVPIGGSIAQSMDSFDRVKLSRALDKAPGKSSTWTNQISGIEYTVTPIKKVAVKGNDFCREYQTVAVRGGSSQQMTGTACVAADGSWSEV